MPTSLVRILYVADTQGELEPCGCSGGQYGGLARRATLLTRLREQTPAGLPILTIDGGGLGADAGKAASFAEAYRLMGYDLVVLSEDEAHSRKALEVAGVGVLVRPAIQGERAFAARMVKADGHLVLIVASAPPNEDGVAPLARALADHVAFELRRCGLDRGSTPVLLLSGTAPHVTAALAQELGGVVDVVAGVSAKGEKVVAGSPIAVQTRDVRTIERGQAVTVIDVQPEAEPPDWRIEPISRALYGHPGISDLVDRYYAEEAPGARTQPAADVAPDFVLRGYAEPSDCKGCHPRAYDVWRESPHAKALATLAEGDRTVNECLPCHSESFRRTGAWDPDGEETGVTCTTCHGDGVLHSLTGRPDTVGRDVSEGGCRSCHTPERQPAGFDFARAWAIIQHGGDP